MKNIKRLLALLTALMLLLSVAMVAVASENPCAEGHDYVFDEHVKRTNACTEDEYDKWVCSRCGKEDKRNLNPALGHLPGVDDGDPITKPTCTTYGTIKQKCPRCEAPLPDRKIPATGHKWKTEPEKTEPSSCTEQGYKIYKCENCSETRKDMLPLKDHSWVWTPNLADCKKGIKQTGECSVCHAKTSRNLPPAEHKWGTWTTIVEPTCSAVGKAEATCTVCGTKGTKELAKKPHTEPNPVRWLRDDKDPSQDYMLCDVCNRIMKRRPHPGYNAPSGPQAPAATQAPAPQAPGQQAPQSPIDQPVVQAPVTTGVQAMNFGPYARDLNPQLFGAFPDRFTPVDVSVDGVQSFPLITNNGYHIGMINVTTSYGVVMVSYTLNDPGSVVSKEVLFLHPVLSAITPEMLVNEAATQQFNQPIDLGGAQYIILNVRLDVAFNAANPVNTLYSDLGVYVDGVQRNFDLLMNMMDTLQAN